VVYELQHAIIEYLHRHPTNMDMAQMMELLLTKMTAWGERTDANQAKMDAKLEEAETNRKADSEALTAKIDKIEANK
jgi:hypothetical protein